MSASELLQKVSIGVQKAKEGVVDGVGQAVEFIRQNPVTSGTTLAGGAIVGGTIIQIAKKRKSSKKKTTKKKKSAPKGKKKVKKKTSKATKRKTKKRVPKRSSAKSRSGSKRIYTAKNGTKYIRMPNGQVRFISNKSSKLRKKRKGGYR